MKYLLLSAVLLLTSTITITAQDAQTSGEKEAAYVKAITQRADKIAAGLGIGDTMKRNRVRDRIAQQYRDLNVVYTARDSKLKTLEKNDTTNKKKLAAEVTASTNKLHEAYLKDLSSSLTAKQVDQIKDGMTYGVLPITYKGYQEMLPQLTEVQKKQIFDYLVEAREHAMDAESSEAKHGWFGKYKGRINNYLSAAGYNMKQAGEDWQKRIKEAAAQNKK